MISLCFIDVRLRKLAEEKDELLAQIRKLKMQLEDEKQKHSKVDSAYTDGERMENGTDLQFIEMQSELTFQPDFIYTHKSIFVELLLFDHFFQTHWPIFCF